MLDIQAAVSITSKGSSPTWVRFIVLVCDQHRFGIEHALRPAERVPGHRHTAEFAKGLRYSRPRLGEGRVMPRHLSPCSFLADIRYQNERLLRDRGVHEFDAWASAFGDTRTELELQPSGNY